MVRPNGNQDRWVHWTCMVKMDSTLWFRVITSLKAFSQLQQSTRPHPSWGRSIGPCSIKQPRIQQSSTESQPKAPKLREMPLIEPSALLELVYSGGQFMAAQAYPVIPHRGSRNHNWKPDTAAVDRQLSNYLYAHSSWGRTLSAVVKAQLTHVDTGGMQAPKILNG